MKAAFTPRTFVRTVKRHEQFAEFLNSARVTDPADAVLDRADDFIWRNSDEVDAAVQAWRRRLDALQYRYGTIDQYDLDGANRAMAAFALCAMVDGKGRGWATWYLAYSVMNMRIHDAIRRHGKSLIRSEDMGVWGGLPETFIVYRGTNYGGDTKMVRGTAWSLDADEAMKFASAGRCAAKDGAIYALDVRKDEVMYYTGERNR